MSCFPGSSAQFAGECQNGAVLAGRLSERLPDPRHGEEGLLGDRDLSERT